MATLWRLVQLKGKQVNWWMFDYVLTCGPLKAISSTQSVNGATRQRPRIKETQVCVYDERRTTALTGITSHRIDFDRPTGNLFAAN